MKARLGLLVLAILVACGPTPAQADGPWTLFDGCHWHFPRLCGEWRERHCWCPDDYCPKTLPCVPPVPKGCVDDYCPKTLPCVPPVAKGCVDDYCPKTCPIVLKCWEPWYKCCPQGGCSSRP
jgi:hypothetical protein